MDKCEWQTNGNLSITCSCCKKWRKFLNQQLEILENVWRKSNDV